MPEARASLTSPSSGLPPPAVWLSPATPASWPRSSHPTARRLRRSFQNINQTTPVPCLEPDSAFHCSENETQTGPGLRGGCGPAHPPTPGTSPPGLSSWLTRPWPCRQPHHLAQPHPSWVSVLSIWGIFTPGCRGVPPSCHSDPSLNAGSLKRASLTP